MTVKGVDLRTTRVLRVVTLASRSGRYGGPIDTALRQAELLRDGALVIETVSGATRGDELTHPVLRTIPVRPLIPVGGYTTYFSLAIARYLWQRVGAVDCVHISMAREAVPIFASICAIIRRKPLVIQPHGMLTSRTSIGHKLIDMVVRPLVRRSNVIVALTETEADDLGLWLRAHGPEIRVVGNPSPTIRPSAQPRRTAVFAARLHPRKRVADFVAASRLAVEHADQVEYIVAGPDQGDARIVEAACREGYLHRYLGGITPNQVSALISRAGVFVLPSKGEPWGNVLATAVKAGIPTVVTRSAALANELETYRAAVVVPDNDPSAIRRAVVRVLDNRDAFVGNIDNVAIQTRFGNVAIAQSLWDVYAVAMKTRRLRRTGPWLDTLAASDREAGLP